MSQLLPVTISTQLLITCNYSIGLRIYCADRKKLRIEDKNPIGTADLEWIFARNCEGTEQLRSLFHGCKILFVSDLIKLFCLVLYFRLHLLGICF